MTLISFLASQQYSILNSKFNTNNATQLFSLYQMFTLLQLPPQGPRVLGMGSGLFAFLFLGILSLIAIMVGRCQKQGGTRVALTCIVPIVIFGLPLGILLISPRADPYNTDGVERYDPFANKSYPQYDLTYRPRVAIGVVQIIFCILAIASFLTVHACKPVEAQRVDNDIEYHDPATHIYK